MTQLTRTYPFRAIHQLPSETGHPGEQFLHGHSYRLEVTLEGEPNAQTGMLYSRQDMDNIINESIISQVDGANLNKVFKWSSGEALCFEMANILKTTPLKAYLKKVSLKETQKNWFSINLK